MGGGLESSGEVSCGVKLELGPEKWEDMDEHREAKVFQTEKLAQAMMWKREICLEAPPKEGVVFKTTSFGETKMVA